MNKNKVVFTSKTMAYLALFAAIQIVLEWMTQFTPTMPRGGNVAFSLVAIYLCSYLMGWGYGFILSMVCLGLHFVLGLATFWGPLSLFFDYVFPFVVVGLASLIPSLNLKKLEIPIGIIVSMVLKFVFHMISGWYAFETPLAGNFAYNFGYNFATLIACLVLFYVLYPRLKKLSIFEQKN